MPAAAIGDLGVRSTNGQWMVLAPERYPNGHTLGANRSLVGHQACLGHGGGHTTWTCRQCDTVVYGAPQGSHCAMLSGPASVRISNITPESTDDD
jgi:hypothetical protein